jgi:hypothetical protein
MLLFAAKVKQFEFTMKETDCHGFGFGRPLLQVQSAPYRAAFSTQEQTE